MNKNKSLIKTFLERLDTGVDAVEEFLEPGCRAFLPGDNSPVDRVGFKNFVMMLYEAFPDLRHEVISQIAEDNEVASVVMVRGTHKGPFLGMPPTQKYVLFADIIVARIDDGKISTVWAQFDAIGLLRQLGGS